MKNKVEPGSPEIRIDLIAYLLVEAQINGPGGRPAKAVDHPLFPRRYRFRCREWKSGMRPGPQ